MNNDIRDIKDRIKIEDLVSQYVQLKKVGRSFKGLCPFHAEKTPSFIVSPERQIAYCFGCNKGGDIFAFIQEVEGIDFSDALKLLAEKAGIELKSYNGGGSGQSKTTGSDKQEMFKIYDSATSFFEDNLWNTSSGKKVLEYLHRRGINDESIKSFRIGFSPDSFDETYNHLIKQGFLKKHLVVSGLALSKDTTLNNIYDRFRGRLMFPILDGLGRIVAFGGRALKKDQNPKYVNSPDSLIYHKSNVLYGFYNSKSFLKSKKIAVVVEGYFDVIAAHQVGVNTAVAPCGTALGSTQLRLLNPFIDTLVLSFDNDLAGMEASKRSYELAQEFDFDVKMVVISDGKDPADFVRLHGSDFLDVVDSAAHYLDYYYNSLIEAYGVDDVSARKKVLYEFLPFFSFMKSSVEKDEYVRRLSLDLGVKEVQIYDDIKKIKLPSYHPARDFLDSSKSSNGFSSLKRTTQDILLGLMIEFPRIGKLFVDKLDEDDFSDVLKAIYKAFADQYNAYGFESAQDVIDSFSDELKEKAALLSLYVSERYGEISEVDVEKELESLTVNVKRKSLDEKKRVLQKKLFEAEKACDKALSGEFLEELTRLNSEGY